jgi:predicted DNA-binding transcriptional regulator AlpA
MSSTIPIRERSVLPDLMTRAEVAEYTGISLATLARWATENSGPRFKKAGSRVIYVKNDVLAWIDRLENGGGAA